MLRTTSGLHGCYDCFNALAPDVVMDRQAPMVREKGTEETGKSDMNRTAIYVVRAVDFLWR